MGKKTSDQHGGNLPSVFSEELLTVNIDHDIEELVEIADESDIELNGFVSATEDGLKHVAPGCFVLIRLQDEFCWTEVLAINGNTVVGRLHNELSNISCPVGHQTSKAVFFSIDQIKALGCERYCWC